MFLLPVKASQLRRKTFSRAMHASFLEIAPKLFGPRQVRGALTFLDLCFCCGLLVVVYKQLHRAVGSFLFFVGPIRDRYVQ